MKRAVAHNGASTPDDGSNPNEEKPTPMTDTEQRIDALTRAMQAKIDANATPERLAQVRERVRVQVAALREPVELTAGFVGRVMAEVER